MPLVKEIPPSIARAGTGNAQYQDIADRLKEDPGEWYRIAEGLKTSQFASGINNGKLKAFRTEEGYFEAVSRTVDGAAGEETTVSVWARYMLPTEDDDEGEGDESVGDEDLLATQNGVPVE